MAVKCSEQEAKLLQTYFRAMPEGICRGEVRCERCRELYALGTTHGCKVPAKEKP
jgi:hypothetical protein